MVVHELQRHSFHPMARSERIDFWYRSRSCQISSTNSLISEAGMSLLARKWPHTMCFNASVWAVVSQANVEKSSTSCVYTNIPVL
jgi:hypothetical protein